MLDSLFPLCGGRDSLCFLFFWGQFKQLIKANLVPTSCSSPLTPLVRIAWDSWVRKVAYRRIWISLRNKA